MENGRRKVWSTGLFVGLTREYLDFVDQNGSVFFRPTKNLLEMAELIADCRIFIGNQSVGYALAEAMKVDSVLEAYPDFLDCMFSRENIIQVAGGRLDLEWITSRFPHPTMPIDNPNFLAPRAKKREPDCAGQVGVIFCRPGVPSESRV